MRITYVLGLNRSGSTIYERALSSAPGVFAAGEVHNLFLSPGASRTCGCGLALRDCPVWSAVVRRVEQDSGQSIDAFLLRAARLHEQTGRSRHIAQIVRGTPKARELAGLVHTLYAAIAAANGVSVVTDSSKGAAGALLLRLMPVDFTVVELVRDPVATIQSNEVGREWDGVDAASTPPAISGARLAATQAAISLTTRVLHKNVERVVFEDFLSDHAGEMLRGTHQCEGNPARFGDVSLAATAAQTRGHVSGRTRAAAATIAALRLLGG